MGKGRRSKWDQLEMDNNKLLLVQGWARDGLTDEQIAHNIGISERTLNRWKKEYPSFLTALKSGKEVADRVVENALYKSAVGFYYEEQAVTNKGDIVTLKKYQKPNVTACIYWLKNRKPAEWRDKREVEQTNEGLHIVVDYGEKMRYVARWGGDEED